MDLKITNELKHFVQTPEVNNNFTVKDKAKLEKAAKEFESLFTQMMLKSMTKTTDGLFGEESLGGDYYQSIFETEMARHISNGKGIGIADFLYRKLSGENIKPDPEKTNNITEERSSGNIKINEEKNIPKIDLRNKEEDFFSIPPAKSSLKRLDRYENIIKEASEKFGVDKNLVKSVILAESAANEKAVSSAKAKGLMQLMDATAKELGVRNVWNPKENIFGGTKYLSQMLRLYNGDISLALASYNAGPGNVEKFNGIPPFEETKNYITRVKGYLNHLNING